MELYIFKEGREKLFLPNNTGYFHDEIQKKNEKKLLCFFLSFFLFYGPKICDFFYSNVFLFIILSISKVSQVVHVHIVCVCNLSKLNCISGERHFLSNFD